MTLHDLCAENGDRCFTIGKSKIVWEAASYVGATIRISRVVETGGKPWFLGLRYKSRYANPDCIVKLVENKKPNNHEHL